LPAYSFPPRFVARWVASMLVMQRRNLHEDAAWLMRRHATAVEGMEHLPRDRRFMLVMNHYERAGLGVWWPAFLVSSAVGRNEDEAPVCWLITNRFYRFRLHGMRLPDRLVSWFLARVAARYGLILVARPQSAAMGRALALRRARRLLDTPKPTPVASTPEGERAAGTVLARSVPTSGKALAWLARSEVPIVPVAVYEDAAGTLVARFGAPFTLPWHGLAEARRMQDALADTVMSAIATCLPEGMRGPYGNAAAAGDERAT
jgi:hypothetical protein